ncbi:MAG: hypothetical protein K940chlam1_00234 [Candidatus Anoxychlamydiales bacterium]|nr:hypothetical protein [Candidatus Anoxychlamydiales bacterium]NGX35652.1 hypothetical protein [Candidatus Anoxychlamydiales bacterium]
MKKYLLIFLIIFSQAFATNSFFKDKLKSSSKNDYIIYEYNQFYSILSVLDKTLDSLVLQEITISKNTFKKNYISFRKWLQNGGKKSLSWSLYEIDLKTNKIKDAYSVSRNCYINLLNNESLITHLLDLDLKKILDKDRKKIGPPPMRAEVDRRALWQPNKIVDSKKIHKPKLDVYRSIWPNDGSEFASKTFDIYFGNDFAFPYFIEINNGHISFMIKAIDSGKDLNTPIKNFPKRDAKITQIKKLADSLILSLKDASHFENFNLFAIDLTKKDNKIIHPIEFEIKKEEDLVFLKMDTKYLNTIFEKNHKYRFAIKPSFQDNIYIESNDLFIWK